MMSRHVSPLTVCGTYPGQSIRDGLTRPNRASSSEPAQWSASQLVTCRSSACVTPHISISASKVFRFTEFRRPSMTVKRPSAKYEKDDPFVPNW